MRVMLGRSGKVVCTLRLPRDYPAQRGIQVIGVEGAEYDAHFSTLQVCPITNIDFPFLFLLEISP